MKIISGSILTFPNIYLTDSSKHDSRTTVYENTVKSLHIIFRRLGLSTEVYSAL